MGDGTIDVYDEASYHAAMKKIESLLKKGEHKLTGKKAGKLRLLSSAVQAYKKAAYTIPAPQTLKDCIELNMYERKLTQKQMAVLLGIGESKLSQIISSKRKADVAFLKALHEKLGIDGNVLLRYV